MFSALTAKSTIPAPATIGTMFATKANVVPRALVDASSVGRSSTVTNKAIIATMKPPMKPLLSSC